MADSPYYRFFRRFTLDISFKKWEKLPRFPAFKNEYWDGKARYSPRPQTCDLYLDLTRWRATPLSDEYLESNRQRVAIRRLRDEDWEALTDTFHSAFADQLPLSRWGIRGASRASRCILNWTRHGHDGPLVRDACFVAWSDDHLGADPAAPLDRVVGAAVVTLAPLAKLMGAPRDVAVPHPEMPDRKVAAHLDWVFVNRWLKRHGIATLLLESIVPSLRTAGFNWLASTCMLDNAPSLMWHWRNGFQLGPGPIASYVRARRVDSDPLPMEAR